MVFLAVVLEVVFEVEAVVFFLAAVLEEAFELLLAVAVLLLDAAPLDVVVLPDAFAGGVDVVVGAACTIWLKPSQPKVARKMAIPRCCVGFMIFYTR